MPKTEAEVKIDPRSMSCFDAEGELTIICDVTTDANYLYVAQTFDETAANTDRKWRCFRVTNANGTTSWAVDPATGKPTREFKLQASQVAAYTYPF